MTRRCPKARQTQMAQGVTGHQLKPMTQLGLMEQMHPGIGKHQAQKAQGMSVFEVTLLLFIYSL